jgi:CarD family transcriptional regulator
MTTRKKATKKPLSRLAKAAKRPSKSSPSAKRKVAKAARPARKTVAKTAKGARVSSRAAAPKTAVRAKSKAERSRAGRAATSAKASARASAKRKAAALKPRNAARASGAAARTAAEHSKQRKIVSVAKKKVESVRKGHDRPSTAVDSRKPPIAAPAVAESEANARELPKAAATPPVSEPVASVKPVKSPVAERPPAPGADETGPKAPKAAGPRQGFKTGEFIVYPAHGVGQIVAVEEQEVAGFRLELFVITFVKDKMTLRVPTAKVVGVGMRKLAEPDAVKKALDILLGRARIKRTMWSRRAQEYETKINSGDLAAISEVVRDLYRSEAQPEQSYSERQLYEAALDRLAREVSVVLKLSESEALKAIEGQLQRGQRRGPKVEAEGAVVSAGESDVEEAA